MSATSFPRYVLLALAHLIVPVAWPQTAQRPVPLRRITAISVPGIRGDFDHFAADEKGGRLFLAGEDHQTLEVFDLQSGRHLKSVTGFRTPHSVLYLPETKVCWQVALCDVMPAHC
jgi:hypothetical protein